MSKNRLQVLPTYIGDMHDLKILKIDHNPIVFPPKDVLDSAGDGEDFRDMRLEQIKKFLRQHAERAGSMHDTESGSRYTIPLTVLLRVSLTMEYQ